MMRNSKRLAALFCTAALILSAAACSGGGDTASNTSDGGNTSTAVSAESQNSENSAESTAELSAENSSESSVESSDESSEPDPGNVLNWTFKETEKPTVPAPVYTKHPETAGEYEKEVETIKPEEFFDYEKAKEAIKNSPRFAGLEFVEIVDEEQSYHRSSADTIFVSPTQKLLFVGYEADAETIQNKYLQSGMIDNVNDYTRVVLSTEQSYSKFDSPQSFEFSMYRSEITQDEVYEEAKAIFGEKLAEYLVYQNYEDKYNDEHSNRMMDEIKTTDDNTYYTFNRSANIYSEKTNISLRVNCYTKGMSRPDAYINGYQPVEWAVPLSQMLAADVGDTDYHKPETFFNKAFAANTKYDSYGGSVIEYVHITQAYFGDGAVTQNLSLTGYRTPTDNNYLKEWASISSMTDRAIEIKTVLHKAADGAISVGSFSMRYPLGYLSNTEALKPEIADDFLSIGKQTVIDLLSLDSKALDGMALYTDDETSDPQFTEIDHRESIDDVNFKVFGKDYTTEIHVIAAAKLAWGGTKNQESEYHACIKIGE